MELYELLYGCTPRRAQYATPQEQRDIDYREDVELREVRELERLVSEFGQAIDEVLK